MKVYVTVRNLNNIINIFADDAANKITLNDKPIKFDAVEFVSRVTLTTFNWPIRNIDNSIIDGESYQIKIIADDNKERKIIGKNSFPYNYADFSKLINEVKNYGY